MIYEPRDVSTLRLSVVREIVRPGTRVLEMGTGTGIIAIAAAKAGADLLVTGTVVEDTSRVKERLSELIKEIQ